MMNQELIDTARAMLKTKLAQCTDDEQMMFKRMYANGDLALEINAVVDRMPAEKLDWAMQQVDNTLKKRASV